MVGRDRELARVMLLLDDALAGRGRLVLCTGEAGIGKTRLAEEAAAAAAARGVLVAWARAADRDTSTASQPAAESSTQSPAAPAAGPPADWRDQILSDARQPWQPGPSWPHHPAIRQTPQAAPDAGIPPDAEP